MRATPVALGKLALGRQRAARLERREEALEDLAELLPLGRAA